MYSKSENMVSEYSESIVGEINSRQYYTRIFGEIDKTSLNAKLFMKVK